MSFRIAVQSVRPLTTRRFQDQHLWSRPGWKPLHWALGFTCICFLIRSVFRTVELSQGYIGYLATHERFFLGLDTLPLWLGVTTFVLFWPGKYLTPESRIKGEEFMGEEEREMVGTNEGALH